MWCRVLCGCFQLCEVTLCRSEVSYSVDIMKCVQTQLATDEWNEIQQ